MSGHNKWSKIKRQKAVADLKKGRVFSKYAKLITLAAKEGGGDPNTNFQLRLLSDKAKTAGMPGENITRAIKRGTGEEKGGELKQVMYEGMGPGGSTFIVEVATDNSNRTLADIKQAFQKNNGRLADSGSVAWNYEHRGLILAESKNHEETELIAIDAGAEDVKESESGLEIYTNVKDLSKVKDAVEKSGATIAEAVLAWVAKTTIEPTEDEREKILSLSDALEELDDVIALHNNLN